MTTTVALLTSRVETILDDATAALARSSERHYADLGPTETRARLAALLELVIASIDQHDLVPVLDHAERIANDRFDAGFDIREVQCAFHVLEEAIWTQVVAATEQDDLVQAIGLVGTVFGAARDALARTYVSRASKQHVASLDLSALFRGGR